MGENIIAYDREGNRIEDPTLMESFLAIGEYSGDTRIIECDHIEKKY